MSHSSLPDKQPDLLPKDRLETILTTLKDPFAIAVIGSLALHGLLWVVLPMLPSTRTDEFDARESVGVVELSPTEQLRLPEFANPQVTFPPLTNQTKLPQPPAANQKNARKPSDPLFDNSSLYNFPLLNFPPPPVLNIPFSSINNLPPIPNDRRRVVIRETRPAAKPSPKPFPSPSTPGAGTTTPEAGAEETPKPIVRPEKLTPEQLAKLLEDGRKNRDSRELFTLNPANTTDKDVQTNSGQFIQVATQLSEGNLQNNKDSWNQQKVVTDLYPKEACPYKLKSNAFVAVLLQPDGTLATKPTVLRSSGYKALDNAAIEYVAKQKFEPNEQYRVMSFPFVFEPTEQLCPPEGAEKPAS